MPSRLLEPRTAALLLGLAAVAILLAVLGFQYLGGLPPCHLCVLQRWPYVGVALLGLIGWRWQPRPALALMALLLLTGAGIGVYHVGVEQGWWALPAGCAAGADAKSIEDLKRILAEAPPACDQVAFTLLGLSLAGWNVVAALALAAYATAAALRRGLRTAADRAPDGRRRS
jgi:disulfide bond formation protein DsbB